MREKERGGKNGGCEEEKRRKSVQGDRGRQRSKTGREQCKSGFKQMLTLEGSATGSPSLAELPLRSLLRCCVSHPKDVSFLVLLGALEPVCQRGFQPPHFEGDLSTIIHTSGGGGGLRNHSLFGSFSGFHPGLILELIWSA